MVTDEIVKPRRTVFVTVGTTCYDALVEVVGSEEVKAELFRKGDDGVVSVDYFTFSSSISNHLRSASLVNSHAVLNEDLMANHQSELAEELAERKHLLCGCLQMLCQTIADMNLDCLLPYPSSNATPVAKLINSFLGFPED